LGGHVSRWRTGRNPVEDRSLMPKKVLLLPDEVEPSLLLIEVVK
jgi:hypothetical protein